MGSASFGQSTARKSFERVTSWRQTWSSGREGIRLTRRSRRGRSVMTPYQRSVAVKLIKELSKLSVEQLAERVCLELNVLRARTEGFRGHRVQTIAREAEAKLDELLD